MAAVSIASDIIMGVVFWSMGNTPMSLLAIFGSVVPVVAVDYYEDRRLKQIINARPPKISPLDYAEAQDLAKQGKTKEAFTLLLLKAYPTLKASDLDKMDATQVRKLLDQIRPA